MFVQDTNVLYDTCVGGSKHGLSAVERAYGRLWSMADRTWQIEHRGEFRLALRRATSLPRGNKRDYVSYKTLVRWRFACALRGSARGFWFIDPLGLRPRGLCTVATRACHVNHAPPSYKYNVYNYVQYTTLGQGNIVGLTAISVNC